MNLPLDEIAAHEVRISELEEFVQEVRQVVKLAKFILMAAGASLGIDVIQYL